MQRLSTFLVFGATSGTGKHFVSLALKDGHRVRALVRDLTELAVHSPNFQVQQGSITDVNNLDDLVHGADFVICMLGDVKLQRDAKINTAFVKQLIPTMRRHGVRGFLYQAGGLSMPYNGQLSAVLWTIKHTIARREILAGQHADNEAVMEYLVEEAQDIQWVVHRAGIGSDGPSKGVLKRSENNFCILTDSSALHTCHLSCYAK